SRRMKDQFGTVLRENACQPLAVLDVAYDDPQTLIVQTIGKVEEAGLPPVKGDDALRAQRQQMLGEPGPDGAGGAGDQSTAPLYHLACIKQVVLHGLPPYELKDIDIGEVADRDR